MPTTLDGERTQCPSQSRHQGFSGGRPGSDHLMGSPAPLPRCAPGCSWAWLTDKGFRTWPRSLLSPLPTEIRLALFSPPLPLHTRLWLSCLPPLTSLAAGPHAQVPANIPAGLWPCLWPRGEQGLGASPLPQPHGHGNLPPGHFVSKVCFLPKGT